MKLIEAIGKITKLDSDATLCVRRPWTYDSECVLTRLDEGVVPQGVKNAGFAYFLEVHVALEVLEVFGKRRVSLEEKARLILHYAETDAYPEWAVQTTKAATPRSTKPVAATRRPKPIKATKPKKR